jgi:cupin 2 domain-containing protein
MIWNFFERIAPNVADERFTTLQEATNFRIERIVSCGHASPEGFWYDQDQHEWIMVLCVAARLHFEGENQAVDLGPGDFLNIPAHLRHRVDRTVSDEPTVWLAVHCGEPS